MNGIESLPETFFTFKYQDAAFQAVQHTFKVKTIHSTFLGISILENIGMRFSKNLDTEKFSQVFLQVLKASAPHFYLAYNSNEICVKFVKLLQKFKFPPKTIYKLFEFAIDNYPNYLDAAAKRKDIQNPSIMSYWLLEELMETRNNLLRYVDFSGAEKYYKFVEKKILPFAIKEMLSAEETLKDYASLIFEIILCNDLPNGKLQQIRANLLIQFVKTLISHKSTNSLQAAKSFLNQFAQYNCQCLNKSTKTLKIFLESALSTTSIYTAGR